MLQNLRLFIDSSNRSLKAVLPLNGNTFSSIPIWAFSTIERNSQQHT